MTLPWPVVLASASPRRVELLRKLIPDFTVDPANLDEDALSDPDPFLTARTLAREKAFSVFERHPEALVIGGDTVVALPSENGEWMQLAKPTSTDDAVRMLSLLSSRTHTVITGVCLRWPTGMTAFTDATKVSFRKIADEEVRAYVATGSPLDKAGAYGLQDGSQNFVAKVEGSVSNVIGLPTERLEEALRELKSGK